jgi:hypothetical protein
VGSQRRSQARAEAVAVDQQGELDAGIFTEGLGVVASAESDGDQLWSLALTDSHLNSWPSAV